METIPLAELAETLERNVPNSTLAFRWAVEQPDRFVAILISLGPEVSTCVMLLAAAALAIPADDPTTSPEDVLRIAAETQGRENWSEVREELTRRFLDPRDT